MSRARKCSPGCTCARHAIPTCPDGCTCGKHQSNPCKPGCMCSRHSHPSKFGKCPDGCTCGRHKSKTCQPGCTCKRHGAAWNSGRGCPEGCACKLHTPPKRPKRPREEQKRVDAKLKMDRYIANPEKYREASRRSHAKNPYWQKYRMTVEEWEGMFAFQGGLCYLCTDPLDRAAERAICVDHDHQCCDGVRTCGKCVRGLTCQPCNSGIGQFGDDPDLMILVADRLEMSQRGLTERRGAP